MSDANSESTNPEPFELISESTNGSNEKLFVSSAPPIQTEKGQFKNDNVDLDSNNPNTNVNQELCDISQNELNEENNKNLIKNNNVNIENNNLNENQVTETKPDRISSSPNKVLEDSSSFLNWLSNNQFINKVVEKAARSVDTVITTLDPGMKKIICNDEHYSGGDINILVTSRDEININLITDAFLDVFKKASVNEFESRSLQTAVQLVGIDSAKNVALQRIQSLRENISIVAQNQVIISIDNFLYNFGEDRWFDSDYFLLDDPLNKIQLEVHTQGTPIDIKYINKLRSNFNQNYKFREFGFNTRLDKIIAQDLNCSIENWHQVYAGFDKKNLYYHSALLLSNLYKNKLRSIGRNVE